MLFGDDIHCLAEGKGEYGIKEKKKDKLKYNILIKFSAEYII